MRLILRAYLALAMLTVLFGTARVMAEPGVTDTEILIGAHTPLSGPGTFFGFAMRDGAQTAIDEINGAGGIHGRKLRILWEDDGFSPAKAIGAVKKLAEDNEVFMVFGASGSNPTVPTLSYLAENKVPGYISAASAPQVTHPFNKYLFRGGTTEAARYGELYAEFLAGFVQAKQLSILSGADEFAKNEADATERFLKDWYGIEPLTRQVFKVGDTDFTPQLLAIRESKPEVLIVNGHLTEIAIILRQARELGLNVPVFVSGAAVDNGLIDASGRDAENVIGGWLAPLFVDSQHPDMLAFLERWKKVVPDAAKGRPNVFDMISYADIHVVAEAMRRAGPDLTRDGFIAALETIDGWRISEVATPRTFTSWHHVGNLKMQMMIVVNQHWVPLAWDPARPSTILEEMKPE